MKRLLFACFVLAPLAACGSDDTSDPPIDAAGDDGTPAIDGTQACLLPSAIITCTVGNDAPCTAQCAGAYCYNFNQLGTVCTSTCSPGSTTECPAGWTCNNMGRCRPPN